MADGFVMPLSGEEIIEDVLDQVRKALRSDCNLRGSDGYSGGYEGKVTVSLTLRSIDNVVVNMEIPITPDTGAMKSEDPDAVTEEVKVQTGVEIPLEPNLDEVRERSGQGVPFQTLDASTGQPEVKRRTYARRSAA